MSISLRLFGMLLFLITRFIWFCLALILRLKSFNYSDLYLRFLPVKLTTRHLRTVYKIQHFLFLSLFSVSHSWMLSQMSPWSCNPSLNGAINRSFHQDRLYFPVKEFPMLVGFFIFGKLVFAWVLNWFVCTHITVFFIKSLCILTWN